MCACFANHRDSRRLQEYQRQDLWLVRSRPINFPNLSLLSLARRGITPWKYQESCASWTNHDDSDEISRSRMRVNGLIATIIDCTESPSIFLRRSVVKSSREKSSVKRSRDKSLEEKLKKETSRWEEKGSRKEYHQF